MKRQKIGLACDLCREHKKRCSGAMPCARCLRLSKGCTYQRRSRSAERDASRGHERSPQISGGAETAPTPHGSQSRLHNEEVTVEASTGNFLGPISPFSWLQQVRDQLGHSECSAPSTVETNPAEASSVLAYGDRIVARQGEQVTFSLDMLRQMSNRCFDLVLTAYFDQAMGTYHFLHLSTVKGWLQAMKLGGEEEMNDARRAVCLLALAHGMLYLRVDELESLTSFERRVLSSEALMECASTFLDRERGMPALESIQARLIKVHHLLSLSRPNSAWYLFGVVIQLSYTLGLHHKRVKHDTTSPLHFELRKRTFWAVYSTDRYISIALGRPTLVHDEFVTQDFPMAINDEDLDDAASSPSSDTDCTVLASIAHAQLAQIVGRGISEHYTRAPGKLSDQMGRNNEALRKWKAALPAVLSGEVKPASLIPVFQRQSIVLRIFYLHCVILINRPYLLYAFAKEAKHRRGANGSEYYFACIDASVELANQLVRFSNEGQRAEVFWFTQNITFNAVSILYLHGLVQLRETGCLGEEDRHLLDLAKRAHQGLAEVGRINSPGLRYSLVLDSLKAEIDQLPATPTGYPQPPTSGHQPQASHHLPEELPLDGVWNMSDNQSDFEFLAAEVFESPNALWPPPFDVLLGCFSGQAEASQQF